MINIAEKLRSMLRNFIGFHRHIAGPTVIIPVVVAPDSRTVPEDERLDMARAQLRAAQEVLIRADINVTFGTDGLVAHAGAGGAGGQGGAGGAGGPGGGGAGGAGGQGGAGESP